MPADPARLLFSLSGPPFHNPQPDEGRGAPSHRGRIPRFSLYARLPRKRRAFHVTLCSLLVIGHGLQFPDPKPVLAEKDLTGWRNAANLQLSA